VPRYLVETRRFRGDLDDLVNLAGTRYPEVALERRYTLRSEDEPGRDTWVCRASTDHHIRRLAHEAGLVVEAISRIESDVLIAPSRQSDVPADARVTPRSHDAAVPAPRGGEPPMNEGMP
jgi:hypothetical protein